MGFSILAFVFVAWSGQHSADLERQAYASMTPNTQLAQQFKEAGFVLAPGVVRLTCTPQARKWYHVRYSGANCTTSSTEFFGLQGVRELPESINFDAKTAFSVERSQSGSTYVVKTSADSAPTTSVQVQGTLAAATWLQGEELKFIRPNVMQPATAE
jgi:hypothetical protein